MGADKKAFYEATARRLAASTVMYGVDSVVHVEDKDDIWFWQQQFAKYRAGRYKFMPATTNEKGHRNTGCTQCLKYRGFLSQRFFVCIDSDLRYLLGEEDINASNGILQTYTYSWENHCAFSLKLQQDFVKYAHKESEFNFVTFLLEYSKIVYEPFLLMLYQERNGWVDFNQDKFKSIISIQYRHGDEQNNGRPFLDRLASKLTNAIGDVKDRCGFNLAEESARYVANGVCRENSYLYIRGHSLYNSLVSIGKKMCEGTGVDFEQNILKNSLAFGQYDAISRIKADIGILKTLRRGC